MKKIILLFVIGFFATWAFSQNDKMSFKEKVAFDNANSTLQETLENNVSRSSGVVLLSEDFEDAIPPVGWSVFNAVSGPEWTTIGGAGEYNYCGSGDAATCSSDDYGSADFDTWLVTPILSVLGTDNNLTYDVNYQNYNNIDFLDVDIKTDLSGIWTTVLSWNEDHGMMHGPTGELVSLDLDTYLVGASNFQIRWRYYDPTFGSGWYWYAQIDNVQVTYTESIPVSNWALGIGLLLISGFIVVRFRTRMA